MGRNKTFMPKMNTWRQHHNSHGTEKRAYASLDEATAAAEERSNETRVLGAYMCGRCHSHHIGRPRKLSPLTTADFEFLREELGVRVAANMKAEVLHPYGSIRQRWLTGVKYALRKN